GQELRALVQAHLDVRHDGVELGPGDEGADVGVEVHRVAHAQALGELHHPRGRLVVERGGDEAPGSRVTDLARVEVGGPEGPGQGDVQVRVVEDHVRALAAELE